MNFIKVLFPFLEIFYVNLYLSIIYYNVFSLFYLDAFVLKDSFFEENLHNN
jgi:hypothetical protein